MYAEAFKWVLEDRPYVGCEFRLSLSLSLSFFSGTVVRIWTRTERAQRAFRVAAMSAGLTVSTSSLSRTPRKRTNSISVLLHSGAGGLGLSVAYADTPCLAHARSRLPLLVTALAPGGAAALSGKIAVGDAIASVNRTPVNWPQVEPPPDLRGAAASTVRMRARSGSGGSPHTPVSPGSPGTPVTAPPSAAPLTLEAVRALFHAHDSAGTGTLSGSKRGCHAGSSPRLCPDAAANTKELAFSLLPAAVAGAAVASTATSAAADAGANAESCGVPQGGPAHRGPLELTIFSRADVERQAAPASSSPQSSSSSSSSSSASLSVARRN